MIAFLLLFVSFAASRLPDDSSQSLFIIERSTNANVVHYDAVIGNGGALNPEEPVVVYWVMAGEDGRRQKLTSLERKHAYGFTIERDGSGQSYWMALVSQKHRPIHIYKEGDKVHAVTLIAGHQAFLHKIYVKTRRWGLLRKADYFELFGNDVATAEDRYEKVAPQN